MELLLIALIMPAMLLLGMLVYCVFNLNDRASVWFQKTFKGAIPVKINDRLTITFDRITAPYSPIYKDINTYHFREYKGQTVAVIARFIEDWDNNTPYSRQVFSETVEFV